MAVALDKSVVAFYYMWYDSARFPGGTWKHWNHEYLRRWDDRSEGAPARHDPERDDIGATFWPKLGAYASGDPAVVEDHMRQLVVAGVGVICVSYWGKPDEQLADADHAFSDKVVPVVLDSAGRHGISVTWHIEPYKGRTARSAVADAAKIIKTFGHHKAFHRDEKGLPVFFVYDSYLTPAAEWSAALAAEARASAGAAGVYLGLAVEAKHMLELSNSHFDGAYTYFASDGFTFGSTSSHWALMVAEAKALPAGPSGHPFLFVPSVGPGYDDTRVRQWNGANTKQRGNGEYYTTMFQTAISVGPPMISITSFNEWHEGTQIEEAIPHDDKNSNKYLDYFPHEPNFYLLLTRRFVSQFAVTRAERKLK